MTSERMISVSSELLERAVSLLDLLPESGTIRELRDVLATQPAANEPAPEFFVEFKTLRRALSIYGISAPESDHELGSRMERYAIRVIEAVAKLPFPYPLAAVPVATGEPVAWIVESPQGCERVKSVCDSKLLAERYESLGWAVTAVFAAPPAAAHGDEAVLWIECDPSAAKFDRLPKDWQFLFSTKFHMTDPGDRSANVVFALHSAMRAQAGEGGE